MSSTMEPDKSSLSIDAIPLPSNELRRDVHTTAVKDIASAALENTENQSSHQLSSEETKISSNVDQPFSERCHDRFTGMPSTQSVAQILEKHPSSIAENVSTANLETAFLQLSTHDAENRSTEIRTSDFPTRPLDVFHSTQPKRIDHDVSEKQDWDLPSSIELPTGGSNVSHPPDMPYIPIPPADWNFTMLLNDIAEELEEINIDDMKFICKGCIVKNKMSKIKNIRGLFSLLEESLFLSPENLIYLQKILFEIGRKDLVEKVYEYVKSDRTLRSVACKPAPDVPVNGSKFVKWHLTGWKLGTCTQRDLESFCRRVALVLCVPSEYVVVVGIEPSNSMLVTLMMPDLYVELLSDLLKNGETFSEFIHQGVDRIQVDNNWFHLTVKETINERIDKPDLMAEMYEQILLLKKQLGLAEQRCEVLELENKCAVDLLKNLKFDSLNSEQRLGTHLENIKKCFSLMQNEQMDREHVFMLMNSYSEILKSSVRFYTEVGSQIASHCGIAGYLSYKLSEQMKEIEACIERLGRSARRDGLMMGYDHTSSLKEDLDKVRTPQERPPKFECLQWISDELNTTEIEMLKKEYALKISQTAHVGGSVLEALYTSVVSKPSFGGFLDHVQLVLDILIKLGRADLIDRFQREVLDMSFEETINNILQLQILNEEVREFSRRLTDELKYFQLSVDKTALFEKFNRSRVTAIKHIEDKTPNA